MDKNNYYPSSIEWILPLFLFTALFQMYSSCFTMDYLMNDEADVIGSRPYPPWQAYNYFKTFGRPLFGFGLAVELVFTGYDPFKIQLVRFINFASVVTLAFVLFYFLKARSKNAFFSFFAVLFFFSQNAFQGIIGYSMLLLFSSQLSIWLSLTAFYLHFYLFPKRRIRVGFAYPIVFIFLLAALETTQTYAFFAMVPLSFLILTEEKPQIRQIVSFFILAFMGFSFTVLLYKITPLLLPGSLNRYNLGENGLNALSSSPLKILLTALNPYTYWSAFKIWTYPFPFHDLPPLGSLKPKMAMGVMALWAALIAVAIRTQLAKCQEADKRNIQLKWLLLLACLGFGAITIIADSPLEAINHRPHVTLTFTGIYLFTGAYALRVLSSAYPVWNSTVARSAAVLLVILNCFGAQSNLLRGIVNNRQDQLSFIRIELAAKPPEDFNKVIVVIPPPSVSCVAEPCDPWFGNITHTYQWHETRKARYQYALTTMGISHETKEIEFVESFPKTIAADELVVDWRKYVTAHLNYSEFLKGNRKFSPSKKPI